MTAAEVISEPEKSLTRFLYSSADARTASPSDVPALLFISLPNSLSGISSSFSLISGADRAHETTTGGNAARNPFIPPRRMPTAEADAAEEQRESGSENFDNTAVMRVTAA